MLLKNSDGRHFDIYLVHLMKKVFRIEKAGDYNVKAFDFANGWLVYSDAAGTSVLFFQANQLSVQSKTQ